MNLITKIIKIAARHRTDFLTTKDRVIRTYSLNFGLIRPSVHGALRYTHELRAWFNVKKITLQHTVFARAQRLVTHGAICFSNTVEERLADVQMGANIFPTLDLWPTSIWIDYPSATLNGYWVANVVALSVLLAYAAVVWSFINREIIVFYKLDLSTAALYGCSLLVFNTYLGVMLFPYLYFALEDLTHALLCAVCLIAGNFLITTFYREDNVLRDFLHQLAFWLGINIGATIGDINRRWGNEAATYVYIAYMSQLHSMLVLGHTEAYLLNSFLEIQQNILESALAFTPNPNEPNPNELQPNKSNSNESQPNKSNSNESPVREVQNVADAPWNVGRPVKYVPPDRPAVVFFDHARTKYRVCNTSNLSLKLWTVQNLYEVNAYGYYFFMEVRPTFYVLPAPNRTAESFERYLLEREHFTDMNSRHKATNTVEVKASANVAEIKTPRRVLVASYHLGGSFRVKTSMSDEVLRAAQYHTPDPSCGMPSALTRKVTVVNWDYFFHGGRSNEPTPSAAPTIMLEPSSSNRTPQPPRARRYWVGLEASYDLVSSPSFRVRASMPDEVLRVSQAHKPPVLPVRAGVVDWYQSNLAGNNAAKHRALEEVGRTPHSTYAAFLIQKCGLSLENWAIMHAELSPFVEISKDGSKLTDALLCQKIHDWKHLASKNTVVAQAALNADFRNFRAAYRPNGDFPSAMMVEYVGRVQRSLLTSNMSVSELFYDGPPHTTKSFKGGRVGSSPYTPSSRSALVIDGVATSSTHSSSPSTSRRPLLIDASSAAGRRTRRPHGILGLLTGGASSSATARSAIPISTSASSSSSSSSQPVESRPVTQASAAEERAEPVESKDIKAQQDIVVGVSSHPYDITNTGLPIATGEALALPPTNNAHSSSGSRRMRPLGMLGVSTRGASSSAVSQSAVPISTSSSSGSGRTRPPGMLGLPTGGASSSAVSQSGLASSNPSNRSADLLYAGDEPIGVKGVSSGSPGSATARSAIPISTSSSSSSSSSSQPVESRPVTQASAAAEEPVRAEPVESKDIKA